MIHYCDLSTKMEACSLVSKLKVIRKEITLDSSLNFAPSREELLYSAYKNAKLAASLKEESSLFYLEYIEDNYPTLDITKLSFEVYEELGLWDKYSDLLIRTLENNHIEGFNFSHDEFIKTQRGESKDKIIGLFKDYLVRNSGKQWCSNNKNS